jgi:hypothetical protein
MVSLPSLFLIEDNANILNTVQSVKTIDDLRLGTLFVKIRKVLVAQDEGRKDHFYLIDHRGFLTGPRNSCYDRGSGSERNGLPIATSFGVEKRTECLF